MHRVVLVMVLVFAACSQEQTQTAVPLPTAPPGCAFDQATIDAARKAMPEYKDGDIEPLAVLSSGLVKKWWGAVVLRHDGSILPIDLQEDRVTDGAMALMVAAGDIITADLIYGDTSVEDVKLKTKGAFPVSQTCFAEKKDSVPR